MLSHLIIDPQGRLTNLLSDVARQLHQDGNVTSIQRASVLATAIVDFSQSSDADSLVRYRASLKRLLIMRASLN